MSDIAGDMLGGLTSGASGFMDLLFWIIIAAALSVGGFFFMYMLQFKDKVRLKIVTSNRKKVLDFRCRTYEDKDKSTWLQLFTFKKEYKLLPMPGSEVAEMDDKGHLVYEGYIGEHGQVVWAKDTAEIKEPEKKILDEPDIKKRKELIAEWSRKERAIVKNEPITSTQRAILINRIAKAQERRKTDWKENIPIIASIASITLLVICLMVFWGDIAKPAIDSKQLTKQSLEIHKETVQMLKELKQGIQSIETVENNQEASAAS